MRMQAVFQLLFFDLATHSATHYKFSFGKPGLTKCYFPYFAKPSSVECNLLTAFTTGIFFKFAFMDVRELITIDNGILGGLSVFKDICVPVESLFDHLEAGVLLDELLDDFPTVSKEQAIALLDIANKLLTSKNIAQLYAAVA